MDHVTPFRNWAAAAALHVCDARFVWLMLIAAITECTSLDRVRLPIYYRTTYVYNPQPVVSIDPWVSPSLKSTNFDVYKMDKDKSEESTGGGAEVDTEKYKNGKLMNEEKSIKYNEEKGKGDEYSDKNGHSEQVNTHGGKQKKATYKKGDKHKKFKTKKGFRDKYHKNEKHKVNEYWDNFETYGTFKKFGKKDEKKIEGSKKDKKNKTKKEGKSKKENKKKGETKYKSGSKGETGHNKENNSDSHYNHESQYHKEKKLKSNNKKNT